MRKSSKAFCTAVLPYCFKEPFIKASISWEDKSDSGNQLYSSVPYPGDTKDKVPILKERICLQKIFKLGNFPLTRLKDIVISGLV